MSERRPLHYDYDAEIKEKYGNTPVYKEYKEKTKEYSESKWAANNLIIWVIFSKFAEVMNSGADPCSKEAQALVVDLQDHLTAYYYTCTDEILAGLGQMYVADERFKNNIDKKNGNGTAEFVSKAIAIYCAKKLNNVN
jgi:hypothetical protein